MEDENTSGETTQPQAEEAFNLDSVVAELTQSLESQPAAEVQEATPEAVVEDTPTPEATPQVLASTKLAERARAEREKRATEENSVKADEARIAEAVEAAKKEVIAELMNSPETFVEKHGLEAAELAMRFYAADLGEDAPDDLKQQIGMSATDRKIAAQAKAIEELRAEMNTREQAATGKAVLDQYTNFLASVPADLPYLAVEESNDALKAMAEVADIMYQNSGSFPSALEVAQLLNAEIEQTAARYAAIKRPEAAVVPQVTAQVKTETNTISNDDLGHAAKKEAPEDDFEAALAMLETLL